MQDVWSVVCNVNLTGVVMRTASRPLTLWCGSVRWRLVRTGWFTSSKYRRKLLSDSPNTCQYFVLLWLSWITKEEGSLKKTLLWQLRIILWVPCREYYQILKFFLFFLSVVVFLGGLEWGLYPVLRTLHMYCYHKQCSDIRQFCFQYCDARTEKERKEQPVCVSCNWDGVSPDQRATVCCVAGEWTLWHSSTSQTSSQGEKTSESLFALRELASVSILSLITIAIESTQGNLLALEIGCTTTTTKTWVTYGNWPGMQVNTRYINSTSGTCPCEPVWPSSKVLGW